MADSEPIREEVVVPDPLMQAEMERLASAPDRKKKQAAEKKKKEVEDKRAEEDLKRQKLELERKKLAQQEENEIHKRHMDLEKMRIEQEKLNSARVKGVNAVRAAQITDIVEDMDAARYDVMRKVNLLKKMGVPGSGKQLKETSPIDTWKTELNVLNSQLNMERAMLAPERMLFGATKAVETVTANFYNHEGASDRFQAIIEAGREAEVGSMEWLMNRAMQQTTINYSHLFDVRPEFFLLGTYVKIVQEQHEWNKASREEAVNENVDALVQDEYEKILNEARGE